RCGSWNLVALGAVSPRTGSLARLTFRMRHGKGGLRIARRPGPAIAGRLVPPALRQRGTTGSIGPCGASQIRPVRLFPRMRLGGVLRWRDIDNMMKPPMPVRRHHGSLGDAGVDHPASLKPERRIDLAALGAVVAVAEFVLADEFAVKARPKLGAEGLAVPPGKKAKQKGLHCVPLAKPLLKGGRCHRRARLSSAGKR